MSFLFRYLRFHDIIGGIHVPVDDGVDKLNRKYTLLVFLFLALPIFTKQYIGDPIECFAPVYFAEHQARYINSYCWTQSTYYMVPVGDPEDDGDQQEPSDRIMPDEVDYFIGFETVTHIGNERLRRVRVSYYQWAPLILLVQGLCFYIPFLIWNSCANNAGVKLRRLLKKASDIASLPPGCQQREALLAEFVDQFHTLVTGEAGWCLDLGCQTAGSPASSATSSQASGTSSGAGPNGARGAPGSGPPGRASNNNNDDHHHDQDTGNSRSRRNNNNSDPARQGCCLISIPIIGHLLDCCLKPCTSFGSVGPSKYLCLLYLAVKSAYVFNVALQFFLLGQFLGRGYLKHGLELMNRLIVNGDWWASPRFPLSTLCQVRADMSGGLRSYTCQCVLPINVFNEKIFSVVWFYMAFLMPLNVLSLLFWIYRTFENNRLSYIRLCLWRTRLVELNQIHRTVRRLSQSYLGWDGVFLLRLIEHNHGSIMATLIMSRLWEFYANQMKLQEDQNQLALANNAHHALSNTTTAISNQHQLLVAAAAAAAASGGGGGGGGNSGGGHLNHSHGPQNHASHAGHSGAHSHPHLDNHIHATPGAGGQHHPPLMPTQQQQQPHFSSGANHSSGAGSHSHQSYLGALQVAPLMPGGAHGAHGQHSGQISQQGHNHPLHAANTHALHAHQPTSLAAHLAGPFAGATNASILAQLQHQQQHHQHSHPTPQQANNQTSNQQQTQSAGPGNVAAAVAALTAAAAANSTTTTTSISTSITAANPNATNSSNPSSANQNQNSCTSQQQASGSTIASGSASSASTTGAVPHSAAFHLHSLIQSSAASNSSGLHTALQVTEGANSAATVASPASSNQQQQQAAAGPLSSTSKTGPNSNAATTSFINNAPVVGALVQGPPLPPPPPAHVVAAVANAGPGMARANQVAAAVAARQPTGITSSAAAAASNQTATPGVLANPVLFNLKSSNIQPAPNGARYSPHTMKRN